MSVWEMTFCSPRALTGNSFKRLNEICDVISNCAWKCGRARIMKLTKTTTAWKVFKYGVFSGPYFSVFGLNTEIYRVNLRIQFKYRKIRTRKNSVFGHFSCSKQRSLLSSQQKLTLTQHTICWQKLNLVSFFKQFLQMKFRKSFLSRGGKEVGLTFILISGMSMRQPKLSIFKIFINMTYFLLKTMNLAV